MIHSLKFNDHFRHPCTLNMTGIQSVNRAETSENFQRDVCDGVDRSVNINVRECDAQSCRPTVLPAAPRLMLALPRDRRPCHTD